MSPAKPSRTTITVLTPAGVSRDQLRRWALRARRRLRLPGRIAIVIIPPTLSKKLNTTYRRRCRATNVLSFDYMHDQRGPAGDVDGELLLCPTVIRREAAKLGVTYRARLRFLLEHGCIHLLGLDHHTPADQRRWERREQLLV